MFGKNESVLAFIMSGCYKMKRPFQPGVLLMKLFFTALALICLAFPANAYVGCVSEKIYDDFNNAAVNGNTQYIAQLLASGKWSTPAAKA